MNNTPDDITTDARGDPSPSTAGAKRSHSEYLHGDNNYIPPINWLPNSLPSSQLPLCPGYYTNQQYTNSYSPSMVNPGDWISSPPTQAPLILPRYKNEEKSKKDPTCTICTKCDGVYSDICPGGRTQKNCKFFHISGQRILCQRCSSPDCDGGVYEGGVLCRTTGAEQVRMLEDLEMPVSLKPPQPLTNISLPKNKTCKWTIDYDRRIVRANFNGVVNKVAQSDLNFLFKMYERPDIVVVSIGLAKNTAIALANGSSEKRYQHFLTKLRTAKEYQNRKSVRFSEGKVKQVIKDDGTWKMNENISTLEDFLKYHEKCKVGNDKDKLYLIDYPLPHELIKEFEDNFLVKDILPGGDKSMLSYAGDIGHAFGPLSFIAVGGGNSGTTFHEDGYGTTDSEHLVLSGYNEVIILRRLKGEARKHAANILGISLYSRPNVSEGDNKFHWPTKETIKLLEQLGYSPTLLVLGPGELIHINKSRLHIFRKVCFQDTLSENDCFFEQRKELIGRIDQDNWDSRCVSIAWDWVFSGNSSLGIARELSTSLSAQFNLSHYQRNNDGLYQAIGKVMHHTVSLACTLFERYNSSDMKDIDLKTIRGILPILAVAKLELSKAEEYINNNGQRINNDANEGRGDLILDRYECAACFGELWGYYVQSRAKESRQQECVCFECYIGTKHIFGRKKFWLRTKHFTNEYVSNLFKTFESLLNEKEGDRYWWETTIRQNLEEEYKRNHPDLVRFEVESRDS